MYNDPGKRRHTGAIGLVAAGSVLAALWAASVAAADFTLKGLDGGTYSLSDYRGQWVIVNYWATWCPPCKEEMPELALFHEEHDNAVVLGVNFEDVSREQLKAFLEYHLVGYPILLADPETPAPLGRVRGLPTTYVVNPEGEAVGWWEGPLTKKGLDKFIERRQRERRKREPVEPDESSTNP